MNLNKNAVTVLEKRYLAKDKNLVPIEDVEGLFHRVAHTIAQGDKQINPEADTSATEQDFFAMMESLRFLPNSPTLMNAGRPLGQLSACFVLPVGDSMEEIFEAVKQAALIHKSGGGTGFSFSRLRAAGSVVQSTGGVASGPISFMKVFNTATEAVKQGGTRRGANMGILRVDHPDIIDFIDCKKDNNDINNFNISVGITEKFMEAVESASTYELIDPKSGKAVALLDAITVFKKIVDSAWRNGEPGIIFLDRLNRDNIVPGQGEIESTNPCGEQPLLPYESCNLGSVNLSVLVVEGADGLEVDFAALEDTVRKAVHFLDNVIEVNKYPLEQIATTTHLTRKIGLGVMGWSDLLLRLGVPYDSDEAVALAERVMGFINETGHDESASLARKRGAFPLFAESIYNQALPLRNGTVTTIAPTGTISIIGGCSSGVEPVFAYAFIRNVMDNTELLEVNPILREALIKEGLYSDELMRKIIAEGSLAHIAEIPEAIRRVFVCAHDISPLAHVRMQSAFQKHTDNAVSKTVNFPHSATREDVAQVFTEAYKQGCKGVTIYRDGSRQFQVLNIGKVNQEATAEASTEPATSTETELSGKMAATDIANQGHIFPRPRPAVVQGITERMKIGCGNLYVTVNYDDKGICEVFTSTGKVGGCPSQSEATARLASIALRSGMDAKEILSQLRGIRCPSTIRQTGVNCTSCPDAIARVLQKVLIMLSENDGTAQEGGHSVLNLPLKADDSACPECGAEMEHEGGCTACRSCGYSKCS